MLDVNGTTTSNNTQESSEPLENKKGFKRFIRIFADAFVPIMPAMIATGLFLGIKGALLNETLLSIFNLSPEQISPDFLIFISVLTETTFAFLPALICWSAFRVFGSSPVHRNNIRIII
ncbi:PTS transporter subunit EIIC [Campylobacter estrildidarum]|nr:PTS transporter subunit EIIC [Campylobacter estrildidarum]